MAGPEQQPQRRQFVNFVFYKVDPAWRRLPESERTQGKQEFIRAVEDYSGKVMVIPYSTVRIRGDCDFMLWRISYELELFQEMSTKILASACDKYLATTYSFGLDDQEWVVAFESDKPEDFLDLVMALRETEGSRYTLRDTPIFTCIHKSLKETLDTLGG